MMDVENKRLKDENERLKSELKSLKSKLSPPTNANKRHSQAFWDDIDHKLSVDTEAVRALIKNGTITMKDIDLFGNTLLHRASGQANEEIARLCINLGIDINAENEDGETALDLAVANNSDQIEQLLLLKQTKSNIGDRIKNISKSILRQHGMIENILFQLSSIDQESEQIFIKILQDLMINLITKKLAFSDDLLVLLWVIEAEKGNPIKSELWTAISTTCKEIMDKGSKRDWYWLKQCILPSNIWFQDTSRDGIADEDEKEIIYMEDQEEEEEDKQKEEEEYEGDADYVEEQQIEQEPEEANEVEFLYFQLLKLAESGSSNQVQDLAKDLQVLEKKHQNDWNELIKWQPKLVQEYEKRQDKIPNGIVSQYTYNQLSESSESTFNSPNFYDFNQYLSQLVLLARVCDNEFQASIIEMFNIDKVTHDGKVPFDNIESKKNNHDEIGDGYVKYSAGPIKLIERARAKAQNDYASEPYPGSACVLDLNRCSLCFNDISTLLCAVKLFAHKVRYYQSGNIIGIIRIKNGFIKYAKQGPRYADIKFNVLIRGQHNNIIGEIQFLLNVMKEFKDKEHDLYDIKRDKEFVNGAKNVLPILLDLEKQQNISARSNDVKGFCNLMVFGPRTKDELFAIDEFTNQSALTYICAGGGIRLLKYAQSLLTEQEFVDRLFSNSAKSNQTPIEEAIKFQKHLLCEYLFSLKSVQNRYSIEKDNPQYDSLRWRLILYVLSYGNDATASYFKIFKSLGITNDTINKYLNQRYIKNDEWDYEDCDYQQFTIISGVLVAIADIEQINNISSIIGKETFMKNVLISGAMNINGLEVLLMKNRPDIFKYLLSVNDLKDKCLKDKNMRWRIIFWLLQFGNIELINHVFRELQFTKETLPDLLNYYYPKPTEEEKKDLDDELAIPYWNGDLVHVMAINEHYEKVIDLFTSIVGSNIINERILKCNPLNYDGLIYAIEQNKLNALKYLLSTFDEIKQECIKNMNIRFRILFWLSRFGDERKEIAKYLVKELNFTKESLTEIIAYKYPKPDDLSHFSPEATAYWDAKIEEDVIQRLNFST